MPVPKPTLTVLFQLNPDLVERKTHHAGRSFFQAFSNLNEHSLGIEMEHFRSSDDWPDAQVDASAHLVAWLVQEFSLELETHPIASHAAVAIPLGRKSDPRGFRWDAFGEGVRRRLGERIEPVRLVFARSQEPIDVELRLVGGASLASARALTAATGLTALVTVNDEGLVAERPFFESHGFRVEFDADARQIEIFPQEDGD
jgi:hypothetical protein